MRELKRVILEALLIVGVGAGIALTANARNPDGLKLSRNYYPRPPQARSTPTPTPPTVTLPSAGATPATQGVDVAPPADPARAAGPYAGLPDEMRVKLEQFLLLPVRHDEVVELYNDPMYAVDLYVIVDARDDKEYAKGHIPGAFHLYYYQEERYVPEVLPAAQGAEKVIVYCNGGDCDDSVHTADLLRSKYMIDPGKIFVYAEGFEHWSKAGLPVETGVRNSGIIVGGGS